jgi:hypothetical protein
VGDGGGGWVGGVNVDQILKKKQKIVLFLTSREENS